MRPMGPALETSTSSPSTGNASSCGPRSRTGRRSRRPPRRSRASGARRSSSAGPPAPRRLRRARPRVFATHGSQASMCRSVPLGPVLWTRIGTSSIPTAGSGQSRRCRPGPSSGLDQGEHRCLLRSLCALRVRRLSPPLAPRRPKPVGLRRTGGPTPFQEGCNDLAVLGLECLSSHDRPQNREPPRLRSDGRTSVSSALGTFSYDSARARYSG